MWRRWEAMHMGPTRLLETVRWKPVQVRASDECRPRQTVAPAPYYAKKQRCNAEHPAQPTDTADNMLVLGHLADSL